MKSSRNTGRGERSGGERPAKRGGRAGDERFARGPGHRPAEDRPAKSTGRRPAEDRPAKSTGRRPAEDRPAKFAGRRPAEDRTARTTGRRPAEDRPARHTGRRPEERAERGTSRRPPEDRSARGGTRRPEERPSRRTPEERPGRRSERSPEERGGRRQAPAAEAQSGGRDGRYVWGVNPVLEALRARPGDIDRLFVVEGQISPKAAAEVFSRARDAGIRVDMVVRERLTTLSEGGVHQGVVAEVQEFRYVDVPDLLKAAEASGRPALIVVLDGIQDPHNLGAIIRSAYALGAHGVVLAKDRAAQVTGVVAKASAGAVEHCPLARVVNVARALEELKQAGLWVVAADPEGEKLLPEARLDGPLALVVGGEGPGIRENVLNHCDFRVRIPMEGKLASLNASVSASVLLYEAVRQRQPKQTVS